MRLQCPNCAAKYDVDETAIPPEGREVECSACAMRWFEKGAKPLVIRRAPVVEERPSVEQIEEKIVSQVSEGFAPPGVPRRSVTPAIVEILRQEAVLEETRRSAAEPEIALTEVPANSPVMPPAARLAGQESKDKPAESDLTTQSDDIFGKIEPEEAPQPFVAPQVVAAPAPAAGYVMPGPLAARKPLRFVEEPTVPRLSPLDDPQPVAEPMPAPAPESLRASRAPEPLRKAAPEQAAQNQSFYWGVTAAIAVVFVLASIYIAAPTIAVASPEMGEKLYPYVQMIDNLRFWLQSRLNLLAG